MNISIVRIADRGVANQERLHLQALSGADLCFYAVIDTSYSGSGVTAGWKNVYWFRSHRVKAGDNIVLYTGGGVDVSHANANGGTDHFFYWGQPKTLWNNPLACAVVFEVTQWITSPR